MDISRSAFFAMLTLNSGVMGLSLREGLIGRPGVTAADVAPAERPPTAIDPDRIPITLNAGPSVTEAGSAPVVTIALRGGAVSLTMAGSSAACPAFPRCGGPAILHTAAVGASNQPIRIAWPFSPAPTSSMRHDAPYVTTIDGKPVPRIAPAAPEPDQQWWTKRMPAQIIAENGSVLMMRAGRRLAANTGTTSARGVVALGVEGSVLSTGTSSLPAIAAGPLPTEISAVPMRLVRFGGIAEHGITGASAPRPAPVVTITPALLAKLLLTRLAGQGAAKPDHSPATTARAPGANMSFLGTLPRAGKSKGMGVAISGVEDHSVSVNGNNHIVTYDDSNVFIERNGEINANTGDTDTSGLYVADVSES